jgi:hypothetical protein
MSERLSNALIGGFPLWPPLLESPEIGMVMTVSLPNRIVLDDVHMDKHHKQSLCARSSKKADTQRNP